MSESLTVNGTDLATLLYSIQATPGSVGAPPMRGGDYETPRRAGASAGAFWAGPRVMTVQGLLYGNNGADLVPTDARARYLDNARALAALLFNGGRTFTVTRVIPRTSGGDLTVSAAGRYLGGLDRIEQVAAHAGRVAIDIEILDGLWYATSDSTLTVTGTSTPSVIGDTDTRRITLTFSGVTATQRLTNSTTGEWVQVPGLSSASTVLDCEAFTATRSAASVAGSVTHNGSFVDWLTLRPGSNSLVLTGGGSCAVAYRGAYL